MVFDNYKTKPSKCLFVTETLGDLREAEKVKLPSLAILDGFHSFETLQKRKSIGTIKCLKEIFKYSVNFININ